MKRGRGRWLVLSLLIAVAFSLPGLRQAFGDDLVIADDARLHVFWMHRFDAPSALREDLIADYYRYLAPSGFVGLYYLANTLGAPPLVFNKVLPLVLVVLGAALTFLLLIRMGQAPPVAALGSAIASLLAWMKDDVPSGTPRAFAPVLLLALLAALAHRGEAGSTSASGARASSTTSDVLLVAIVLLHALFYPSAALVAVGVLALVAAKEVLDGDRARWVRSAAVAGVSAAAAIVLLAPSLSGPFGTLYDAATTRGMAEFAEGGRFEYWSDEAVQFWLVGPSSGLVGLVQPSIALCGAFLPLLLVRVAGRPATGAPRGADLLALPLIAGLALFVAAHLFFPRLYFPGRYFQYTLRAVLAPASAIVIAVVIARVSAMTGRRARATTLLAGAIVGAGLLAYPVLARDYPIAAYHRSRVPELHRFLRASPGDSVVASLSALADDVPTFAARAVLVSPHYSIPLHRGYYDRQRGRVADLLAAQYTDDPQVLAVVLRRWSIDFWLLDADFDTPSYLHGGWLRQFAPEAEDARAWLEGGGVPLLREHFDCTALEGAGYRLLDARCLLTAIETPRRSS